MSERTWTLTVPDLPDPAMFDGHEQPPCTCTWYRSGDQWSHDEVAPSCCWHFERWCCPGEHGTLGGPYSVHTDGCDRQPRLNGRVIR